MSRTGEQVGRPPEEQPAPQGAVELRGRIMPASNATFLGELDGVQVVYKPEAGERPLWDFPDGTLAGREVAAYLVSRATGWDVVPQTWLATGPHGLGMMQRWQEPDPEQDAVAIVGEGERPDGFLSVFAGLDERDRAVTLVHEDTASLRRMAVFDVLVNNADRKGGHVLEMTDGHRYGVDHGVALHHEHKLRTVLWGWRGDPLSDEEVDGVLRVRQALGAWLGDALADHLTDLEISSLEQRARRLLDRGCFPVPRGEYPAIPWPPF